MPERGLTRSRLCDTTSTVLKGDMKAIIAAALIVGSLVVSASAECSQWILWEESTLGKDRGSRPFDHYPTEAACLQAGRKHLADLADGYKAKGLGDARLSKPPEMTLISGTTIVHHRCWPVGVNPR